MATNENKLGRMNPTSKKADLGKKMAQIITLLNEIRADLTTLVTDFNAHTHDNITAGAAMSEVPATTSSVAIAAPAVDVLDP